MGDKRRTYICRSCGHLRRLQWQAEDFAPSRRHSRAVCSNCGDGLWSLTHEQGVAATRVRPEQRLKWLELGGNVLRVTGKKRWRPATRARDIEAAKAQERDYLAARSRLEHAVSANQNKAAKLIGDLVVSLYGEALGSLKPAVVRDLLGPVGPDGWDFLPTLHRRITSLPASRDALVAGVHGYYARGLRALSVELIHYCAGAMDDERLKTVPLWIEMVEDLASEFGRRGWRGCPERDRKRARAELERVFGRRAFVPESAQRPFQIRSRRDRLEFRRP